MKVGKLVSGEKIGKRFQKFITVVEMIKLCGYSAHTTTNWHTIKTQVFW
jgi:hypothetical protein